MRRFITLTTDFGLSDPYVASMKGSIYTINPDAAVIDVSHDIRPQAIEQGAFVLEYALPYLPPDSIHVMVVDPGVGTSRRAVALVTPNATFVGPDNGLLSAGLPDEARPADTDVPITVPVPEGCAAYELTNDALHRKPVSVTFHGRDIFSPVAAHLSLGIAAEELGPPMDELLALPPFCANKREDGTLEGRIVHIDRYGNLISDVRGDQLSDRDVKIEIAGRAIAEISRTYADSHDLMAIVASTGFLAIVLPNGSAERELGVDIGEPVRVRRA